MHIDERAEGSRVPSLGATKDIILDQGPDTHLDAHDR